MLGYEEEIESLNSNLDRKNEFIVALQDEIKIKSQERAHFINQLELSSEKIK